MVGSKFVLKRKGEIKGVLRTKYYFKAFYFKVFLKYTVKRKTISNIQVVEGNNKLQNLL